MITADIRAKFFGTAPVLGQIGLRVEPGEVLAIEGPSGAGKSTLLRILAGLDPDFEGSVSRSGRLGMVFQEPRLLPWRNVGENIRLTTRAPRAAIAEMLTRVGLAGYQDAFPRALSLGQARRVALARAFVTRPAVLILDEPFTSLDPERVADLLALTGDLIATHRPATIFVTHSPEEARTLAHRRMQLSGCPAQLLPKPG
ncbi:MAG: ABC transporter ATP-binding protein [Paracoccus sp. (in: a-proteobacteria)]